MSSILLYWQGVGRADAPGPPRFPCTAADRSADKCLVRRGFLRARDVSLVELLYGTADPPRRGYHRQVEWGTRPTSNRPRPTAGRSALVCVCGTRVNVPDDHEKPDTHVPSTVEPRHQSNSVRSIINIAEFRIPLPPHTHTPYLRINRGSFRRPPKPASPARSVFLRGANPSRWITFRDVRYSGGQRFFQRIPQIVSGIRFSRFHSARRRTLISARHCPCTRLQRFVSRRTFVVGLPDRSFPIYIFFTGRSPRSRFNVYAGGLTTLQTDRPRTSRHSSACRNLAENGRSV